MKKRLGMMSLKPLALLIDERRAFIFSSMGLRRLAQSALTRVGARCSPSHIRSLNAALNYLEVGRWLAANGYASSPRYRSRELLYAALAERFGGERVLYLEFGVWEGHSMRQWSRLLTNPLSSLHGFDSFEGLPENWDADRPKGTFDVGGKMPVFDDSRVQLHQGWFEETLPTFVLPEHERLVLNLDADLYSSTRFVLETLLAHIEPGTVIVFDEFCDRQHELRAFADFLEATKMRFQFVGATTNLEHVAFERDG